MRITPDLAAQYIEAIAKTRRLQQREDGVKVHRWWSLLETSPEAREAFQRTPDKMLYEMAQQYSVSELEALAENVRRRAAQ